MKHLFVINPRSFPVQAAQDKVIKEIEDCFETPGSDEYAILTSRYPRDAIGLIRKWMKEHRTGEIVRVYAVGGDGILFDCLNGIVDLPNTELAAIPYGTANDFVRAFGEDKKELFRNIKLQATSQAIPTDIIHCGNIYALNFCTVGMESYAIMSGLKLYSNISKSIKKYQRLNRFIYRMFFYLGAAKSMFNKKIQNEYYTVSIDGEDYSGIYGTINIANGPCYGVDMSPVVTAMPDDGIIDAVFFRQCANTLKLAFIITDFVKGKFRKYPDYFFWKRFKKIEIRSGNPLHIDLDGEVFYDSSLTLQLIPHAIKFTAPGGISYLKRADG